MSGKLCGLPGYFSWCELIDIPQNQNVFEELLYGTSTRSLLNMGYIEFLRRKWAWSFLVRSNPKPATVPVMYGVCCTISRQEGCLGRQGPGAKEQGLPSDSLWPWGGCRTCPEETWHLQPFVNKACLDLRIHSHFSDILLPIPLCIFWASASLRQGFPSWTCHIPSPNPQGFIRGLFWRKKWERVNKKKMPTPPQIRNCCLVTVSI